MVYAHAGASDIGIRALIDDAVDGIVYAGTGNANIPDSMLPAFRAAADAGIHVVRASRTGSGSAVRNPDPADFARGWVAADDQNPQKARLLLALALTKTRRVEELRGYFNRY